MSNQRIEKVRQLVTSGELTRAGLARAAGLHANTLRDCSDEGWNPTAETLAKIESFLLHNDESPVLVGIEEIIAEARNGRMFILVDDRSEEHTSELQSLMRTSYAVFRLTTPPPTAPNPTLHPYYAPFTKHHNTNESNG